MSTQTIALEPIARLRKDLREAAGLLSLQEVRYLVDLYYQIQDFRKATANQIRALSANEEPVNVLGWSFDTMRTIEVEIKRGLDIWTDQEPSGMGAWAKRVCGIGPIISAGLLAHIDITKAPTVGHIWRFAGLDPTVEWKPKTKRPWNAALKTLLWKLGESFVKVSSNEADVYGKIWAQRKALEEERNAAGLFSEQAAKGAARVGKSTQAYQHYASGKLSPGHVHARAKRYAVKLFLSHWWEEAYRRHYGSVPPSPYAIAILGHAHKI